MSRATSDLEQRFLDGVREAGFPEPQRELRLVPGRQFCCDFIWDGPKVVVEVEGGLWMRGRHTTAGGIQADMEKYNLLAILGWLVLRVSERHIATGVAYEWLFEALAQRGAIVREEEHA